MWDDPATGHYWRDAQNKLARVEATAAVFLGTEIGCAQCHNAPYDPLTRMDYHQFAAFFRGATRYIPNRETFDNPKLYDEIIRRQHELRQEASRKRDQRSREFELSMMSYVNLKMLDARLIRPEKYQPRLPTDYQYHDGKPKQLINPRVLFGTDLKVDAGPKTMDVLADWLTSPKNPKFTLTVVNRLWATLMGAPIAGPLTNVLPPDECRNPELVRFLIQTMIDARYDQKQFLRVVLNSKTYQRQASAAGLSVGEGSDFPGPLLRRMTAEQVWDSLMTLRVADLDATSKSEKPDYSLQKELVKVRSADEYFAILERERTEGRGGLALRNEKFMKKAQVRRSGFLDDDLKRASELPSPTPDGHFIRLFGQSDRETTDAAWVNPTTPQALAMMNGPLLDELLDDDSVLAKVAKAAGSQKGQMRVVYLALLSREPTPSESDRVLATLGADGPGLWKSLAWTLLNSRQFLFVK